MQLEQLRLFQDNVMNTKACGKCKEVKPYSDFSKNKTKKQGVNSECKDCRKQYRKENKHKTKQYQEENKEKIKRKRKQYNKENKERRNQQKREWYQENKEKVKQYQEENKEKIKQLRKQYLEENKEKINQYRKQRKKTDPVFKLSGSIRTSLCDSLRKNGYTKKTRSYKILGIEYKDFYNWLNTKASNGLNYDKDDVHIDHVIPVSFADTEEEVLTLNHYSNLQLLTGDDNLAKSNRYINKTNLDRVFQHHPNRELLKNILSKNDYLLS